MQTLSKELKPIELQWCSENVITNNSITNFSCEKIDVESGLGTLFV